MTPNIAEKPTVALTGASADAVESAAEGNETELGPIDVWSMTP